MTTGVGRPKGRRLEPIEAFEVTPWRTLALFRLTSLVYALALTAANFTEYAHPILAWVMSGVMVVWSILSIKGYERAPLRAWPLLLVDLGVTALCVLASGPVVGLGQLAEGMATLTASS